MSLRLRNYSERMLTIIFSRRSDNRGGSGFRGLVAEREVLKGFLRRDFGYGKGEVEGNF